MSTLDELLIARINDLEARLRLLENVEYAGTAGDSDTVDTIHAAASATANKLLALNASSKLPASITGDADTLDTLHAATSGADAHVLATDASGGITGSQNLTLTGQIKQSTNVIRAAFSSLAIADNVATSVFTITTTDEAGSTDGGGYSVWMHWLVGHVITNNSGNSAAKSLTAQFCRAMRGAAAGANSAISEVIETASAATASATRDIGTVTVTVVETSEFIQTVQITVDLTGSAVGNGQVMVLVELVWSGFLTAPVLAAA